MMDRQPVEHRNGLLRVDDVYSVLWGNGDVIYELARTFRDAPGGHAAFVARLPWRAFLNEDEQPDSG